MAFVFQRRLAVPLWAIAFLTVALTAPPTATLFLMPPTTVFAIVAVGIAAIVFLMPGSLPWWRTSRAPVRVLPSGHRDPASAANDALDLSRMDDDGGWQMARPPA
jgi:uncharacterized iron-regulated membrane protein